MEAPLTAYLYYAFGVNLFRTVVYIVNQEHVSKVKVTKQAWEDMGIREIMYSYTGLIRMFMCFRAAVCYWAATELAEGSGKVKFCAIVLAFDIYLMVQLVRLADIKAKKVLQHQQILVPGSIQASLCIAGTLGLALHFYAI